MVAENIGFSGASVVPGVGDRGFVHLTERHEAADLHGAAHSHVAWGAVIAGGLSALALLALASALAVALGIDGYRGNGFNALTGIWTVLAFAAAFFVGGCLSTYLTSRTEMRTGIVHGMLAWVLGVMLILVMSGAVIGTFRGSVAPDFRVLIATGDMSHAQILGAAWTSFLALFLSLITALIGGVVGCLTALRGRSA